jgi:hypothetical protein
MTLGLRRRIWAQARSPSVADLSATQTLASSAANGSYLAVSRHWQREHLTTASRTKETLSRRAFVERRLSRAAAAGFGDWQRQGRGPNRRSGLILINDLELLDWGKEG